MSSVAVLDFPETVFYIFIAIGSWIRIFDPKDGFWQEVSRLEAKVTAGEIIDDRDAFCKIFHTYFKTSVNEYGKTLC